MNRQLAASLLLVCAVASSLWWVYTLHQSRSLFLQLEQLSTQHDEAMAEWSRLQIEQATFADASRVEQIARDRLNMIVPEKLALSTLVSLLSVVPISNSFNVAPPDVGSNNVPFTSIFAAPRNDRVKRTNRSFPL